MCFEKWPSFTTLATQHVSEKCFIIIIIIIIQLTLKHFRGVKTTKSVFVNIKYKYFTRKLQAEVILISTMDSLRA